MIEYSKTCKEEDIKSECYVNGQPNLSGFKRLFQL
jgi:hypothetical protein